MDSELQDGPPPLLIEQLHLGELPQEQEAALVERYGREAIDAALRSLSESDATLAARYPTDVMARAIEGRVADARAARRRRRLGLLAATGPVVAAAAAALLIVRPGATPVDEPGPTGGELGEVTRLKGDALDVRAFRRRPNPDDAANPYVEALGDGAKVRAGDVLQLGYASAAPYATMLSVDGRGAVTLHFPAAPTDAPKLPRASGLLPFAYELDDSPHFERFYLFSHTGPFEVSRVQAALEAAVKRAGTGKLPQTPALDGFAVATLTLKKVTP